MRKVAKPIAVCLVLALLTASIGKSVVMADGAGGGWSCPLDSYCVTTPSPCRWAPPGSCGCYRQNIQTAYMCVPGGPHTICNYFGNGFICAEKRLCVEQYFFGSYLGCWQSAFWCTGQWSDRVYGTDVYCP